MSRRRDEVLNSIEDPFVRRAVKSAYHVRRYLPFYVMGLVWVLALALVPTINGSGGDDAALDAGGSGGSSQVGDDGDGGAGGDVTGGDTAGAGSDGGAATGDVAAPGDPGSGSRAATGRTGGSGSRVSTRPGSLPVQTGKTRSGAECKPGVRQFANSAYALPCAPVFSGDNGGATYRGVSKDKIRIVLRKFPDSPNQRAVDEVNSNAGFASRDTVTAVRNEFIKYFNKVYELYGRQVELVTYTSENGDSTAEAQSKGREGACADATKIVQEIKAFGVFNGNTGPFSDCAAERKLVAFNGGAYFPEAFFAKRHPYVWNTLMECERISYQVGEYVGKRLLNRKAKWAGDPLFQGQNRKFATYVPDNDEYQHCVKISERVLKDEYGGAAPSRYNYQLDISRFPDQAAQAIVQFKADGATTIINACDYISTIFLTQAANSQSYRPEWFIIGVAAQDTDNAARLYDQNQVDGHLFGMSQLGSTNKLLGPNTESGRVYRAATGKTIPAGTTGDYYTLVHMFNMLQAAGPELTPENMASGALAIPASGAPDFSYGYWSMQDGPDGRKGAGDHTEVDDGREIYWVGSAKGPDGSNGTYLETYGGKRFRNGEWPAEEPKVYPGK